MTARSLFRRLRRDKNRCLPWKSLWQRPGIVSGLLGASEHYQLSDDIASGNTEYRISKMVTIGSHIYKTEGVQPAARGVYATRRSSACELTESTTIQRAIM